MRFSRLTSGDDDLPLYRLEDEDVVLTFLPAVGGRLLSAQVGGTELLWRNPAYFDDDLRAVRPRASWTRDDGTFATWANVGGSKTWPAPQGWDSEQEWPGPPGSPLDNGAWTIDFDDASAVHLASADDPRTGLSIRKCFALQGGRRFTESITFTNTSDAAVTWAVWEVAQVLGHQTGTVRVWTNDDMIVNLGDYHGSLEWSHDDGRAELPMQDVVAKRGFPSAAGTIEYDRGDGYGVRIDFPIVEDEVYPDAGSRAEVWLQAPMAHPIEILDGLHPDALLAELEVLSPLTSLAPGEAIDFCVTWELLAGER